MSEAIEGLHFVIAGATNEADARRCLEFRAPIAPRYPHSLVALPAPSVRARALGARRPEEAHGVSIAQTLQNMPTHERLRLDTMAITGDRGRVHRAA